MRTSTILILLIMTWARVSGQGADWHSNVKGKLHKADYSRTGTVMINKVFDVINELTFISQPMGFDVKEWYTPPEKKGVFTGRLLVNFYEYYSFGKGPVKLQTSHPHTIALVYNDPSSLMNFQSILFPQETEQMKMPAMFTDTFALSYKTINGAEVGMGIITTFDSQVPMFVLNPARIRFFRPLTQAEYIRFFIGKLGLDIEKDARQLEENKTLIKEISNSPLQAVSLPELEKANLGLSIWVAFLRSKKNYFEKRLSELSDSALAAPASYVVPKVAAVITDRNGRYVGNITGHLPYEPNEGQDAIFTRDIFTFVKSPFNTRLSPAALQLIVIEHEFSVNEKDPLKDEMDQKFFSLLSYGKLAALMLR
jgi:hypothetical protein